MNNVLIVANFSAGRKQAIKYRKNIQKFLLRKRASFHFITIDQLSEADMDLFDTILVVGGDGTVNKVLPYLVNTTKTLGIIPCGTANLLASKLGINGISNALKVIDKENVKKIDVMTVNGNLSVLRCGIGYDADIIGKTPQSLKNKFGYFAYFVAGIIFALRLKQKEYQMTCNQETVSISATCIIAANTPNMYKNWISVSKASQLDDGFMEIFVLKTINPFLLLAEIFKMFLKIQKTSKNALYLKTDKLILVNNTFHAHIDGEKRYLKNSINIEVIPQAVNVITGNIY